MFEECGGEWAGSSICGEYEWSEGDSLNFTDSFFILFTFGSLMSAVAGGGGGCSVGGCIWVKDVDIEGVF